MAAKQNNSFKDIMSDLKACKFSPIYILMGEEAYYIDKISEYIEENVLTAEEKEFNQTVFFGYDSTAVKIFDTARRFPIMAKYQVIIVKEAQNIRSLSAMEKYLNGSIQSTIIVWCYKNGKIDSKNKLLSLVRAVGGVIFESKKLKDYQLTTFINDYLKTKNIHIEPKAAQIVADQVGNDLNRLSSELNKVVLYLPKGTNMVTSEIVENSIGISKDFNAYELRNAIINKDVLKANRIINYFNKNPKATSLYSLLPLLFTFFENLLIVHYSNNNYSENSIATLLDLKYSWAAKDYIIGIKKYSIKKTIEIIYKFRDIDAKSKGINNPNTVVGELMKELIFFILH